MRGDWIKRYSPMAVELNNCVFSAGGYEMYTCNNQANAAHQVDPYHITTPHHMTLHRAKHQANIATEFIFNNSKCEGEPLHTITITNGGCFANPLTPWAWYYITTWVGPNCGATSL